MNSRETIALALAASSLLIGAARAELPTEWVEQQIREAQQSAAEQARAAKAAMEKKNASASAQLAQAKPADAGKATAPVAAATPR